MIPIRDDNPTRRIPWVNLILITANLGVFIYQYFYLSQGPVFLINRLGFIPREAITLTDMPPVSPIPLPLTLFTAMFIHGGWLHLLGNMLYLWIFGDNVEDRLGHGRYFLFYIGCGMSAALLHAILFARSQVPCVGASGAIAGVLAAYLLFFPKARVSTLFVFFVFFRVVRLPAVVLLLIWIGLQVASGITELSARAGGVAWFAHIGGFAGGLLFAFMFRPKKSKP